MRTISAKLMVVGLACVCGGLFSKKEAGGAKAPTTQPVAGLSARSKEIAQERVRFAERLVEFGNELLVQGRVNAGTVRAYEHQLAQAELALTADRLVRIAILRRELESWQQLERRVALLVKAGKISESSLLEV